MISVNIEFVRLLPFIRATNSSRSCLGESSSSVEKRDLLQFLLYGQERKVEKGAPST
jgi:hypothetical protein